MTEEPRKPSMRKPVILLGAVLGVLVVAGGSFFGGMAFQRYRQTSVQQQFFADRGFGTGGQAPLFGSGGPQGEFVPLGDAGGAGGQAVTGRGANGTVGSLEGDTLQLTTAEGDITVTLTDETVLTRTATAERSDLQAGARVAVIGERDDSGVITAAVIQILPDTPQE
jgi:hypothetical protein